MIGGVTAQVANGRKEHGACGLALGVGDTTRGRCYLAGEIPFAGGGGVHTQHTWKQCLEMLSCSFLDVAFNWLLGTLGEGCNELVDLH